MKEEFVGCEHTNVSLHTDGNNQSLLSLHHNPSSGLLHLLSKQMHLSKRPFGPKRAAESTTTGEPLKVTSKPTVQERHPDL